MFIKKLSRRYANFIWIIFNYICYSLGVGAAFIRRFFSNLRKKYFKKLLNKKFYKSCIVIILTNPTVTLQ